MLIRNFWLEQNARPSSALLTYPTVIALAPSWPAAISQPACLALMLHMCTHVHAVGRQVLDDTFVRGSTCVAKVVREVWRQDMPMPAFDHLLGVPASTC